MEWALIDPRKRVGIKSSFSANVFFGWRLANVSKKMSDKDTDVDNSDLTFLPSVSANDKSLANISCSDFLLGKYVECMQSIYKLVSNRPSDPKVIHNKAVIEYFLSDFKRTDEFKKNLYYVCSQVRLNF